jgi:O-antigen ligase
VREGFFVPVELKLFAAFCLWGMFGLLVARFSGLLFSRLITLAQLLIMALIISYYSKNSRCISWLFFAVLIGVFILAAAAVVTGDYKRAESEGEIARLGGLTMNSNAFAIAITNGIAILLYFFRQVRSKILKLVIIGGILAGIRFVIGSGSRKGFIGVVILIFFWFLFTYLKELRKRPLLVIAMFLGVVAVGLYTAYLMRDTVLITRFTRLGEEARHGSAASRIVMVKEGIRFTASHPVLGIGLNHFQVYSSSGLYAHNNYAEVFSTTGIPGGILYNLIYVIIFYRLHKVGKLSLLPSQRNVVTIFKCLMLLRLVWDLGVVSYYSKMDWIFLAIIIGGLSYLQRDVEAGYAQGDNTGEFVQNVPAAES